MFHADARTDGRTGRHDETKSRLSQFANEPNKMCVLFFSTTFARKFSHSKKISGTYYHKCTLVIMQSTRYSCQILMTLEYPRRILKKHSNIKFPENPSSGSRLVPCGRTHMTKVMAAFRSFSNASKNHTQIHRYRNEW